MTFTFDIHAAVLLAGALHILLGLAIWGLLHRRRHKVPVRLWSLGTVAAGLAVAALGLHGRLPAWLVFAGVNLLMHLALVLHALALRFDLERPPRPLTAAAVVLLGGGLYLLTELYPVAQALRFYPYLALTAGSAVCARYAAAVGRALGSPSGAALAWIEGLVALAVAIRLLLALAGIGNAIGGSAAPSTADVLLLALVVTSALYGNLGYVGTVLDRTRASQSRALLAQMAEAARREAAENAAAELRGLLAERDRMVAERNQLLQVLAHEIRQPLHNAGGALQAAGRILQAPQPDGAERAGQRLLRAQAVLADVRSVLDNTLAAATLLSRQAALTLQEVELDMLIQLALGDLPEAQRARVRVERCVDFRSTELEPGLVRLALRNLLRNAFTHGGDDVAVTVRVEERKSPPAVVLSVLDDGPDAAAALEAAAAGAGSAAQPARAAAASTPAPAPLRGLGLFIVRQVMGLHGGSLTLAANRPRGLVAALAFPLDAADEPAAD